MRVGGDPAGVVIDVGGDDAGADYGKEKSDAAAPGFAAREKIERPGAEAVDDIVDGESSGMGARRKNLGVPGSRRSIVDS